MKEQILDFDVTYYEGMIELFKFNQTSNILIGLYHIWEQQIKSFYMFYTGQELSLKCVEQLDKKKKFISIREIRDEYKKAIIDLNEIKGWEKIDELRILVNTLKHGKGNSFINSKLFKNNQNYNSDEFEEYDYNSTLSRMHFELTSQEIGKFKEAILGFWDSIPFEIVIKL